MIGILSASASSPPSHPLRHRILSAITAFTVRGTNGAGRERACATDGQTVEKAADFYFAQFQMDVTWTSAELLGIRI